MSAAKCQHISAVGFGRPLPGSKRGSERRPRGTPPPARVFAASEGAPYTVFCVPAPGCGAAAWRNRRIVPRNRRMRLVSGRDAALSRPIGTVHLAETTWFRLLTVCVSQIPPIRGVTGGRGWGFSARSPRTQETRPLFVFRRSCPRADRGGGGVAEWMKAPLKSGRFPSTGLSRGFGSL